MDSIVEADNAGSSSDSPQVVSALGLRLVAAETITRLAGGPKCKCITCIANYPHPCDPVFTQDWTKSKGVQVNIAGISTIWCALYQESVDVKHVH